MKKKTTNTHFTLETRTIIENRLNEKKTVTEIANELRRDRSNVGREIIRYREPTYPSMYNKTHPCLKFQICSFKSYECYKFCKVIEVSQCDKLASSPHVCNGCTKKNGCRHVKYYYNAIIANNKYTNSWSENRQGLHYTELELSVINTDLKMLVLKNKSLYHSLIVINKRGFNFKLKTIYSQIERGQLAIKSSDLPRCRSHKGNRTKDTSYKRENIDGKTYEDYEIYKNNHTDAIEMQMDTVEGVKENNAPVLLTLEIVKIKFIFIFKIDSQTKDDVCKKLQHFQEILGEEIISKIMEVLLTDNGKEFIDWESLENALVKEKVNIFYCHPYSSYEKGEIENNHEIIRRVIPKGISLKCYSQNDINLLTSHANSLYRKILDGKCPFDLIYDYIPKEELDKLSIYKIQDDEVTLTPYLLGEKNINNIKKYLDDKDMKEANIIL